MKKYLYYLLSIFLGTAASSLIWLAIYNWRSTRTNSIIEFDGPAGSILFMVVITGAVLTALICAILFYKRYKLSKLRLFWVAIVGVIVSCMVIGFLAANYSVEHYSSPDSRECPIELLPAGANPADYSCTDDS